uniref:Transmembrane protein 44 n=1 Tax=Astyanax mexicanus TaxID=7994 RepID=A0A8B9KMQ4_ASTMX
IISYAIIIFCLFVFSVVYSCILICHICVQMVMYSEFCPLQGRAETGSPLWLSSRGLKALSGGLYASAILVHDTRLESIVRALPWILSGSCCAILDVIILFVSCYRVYSNGQSVQPLSTDTASLLGRRLSSGQLSPKKDKPARKLHHPSRRSSTATEAEIGCYMDVHLQPVRKVCLKEVTITREGSVDSQPLRRCVKVVRVDECYSSGSTTDSSSVSSELEVSRFYVLQRTLWF